MSLQARPKPGFFFRHGRGCFTLDLSQCTDCTNSIALKEQISMNTPRKITHIACVASDAPKAQAARAELAERHDLVPADQADALVALGGDGFMLQTMHEYAGSGVPIYGMNRGTIGFLLNQFNPDNLLERLNNAQRLALNPLVMNATTVDGRFFPAQAFNEVSLHRYNQQSANIRVLINGRERLDRLVCDGIMLATPAGSTAYNLSARGPIIPLGANMLALTPVCPFRPRRWNGALLPHTAVVEFEILDAKRRPVGASADSFEVRDVAHVRVVEDQSRPASILFDQDHSLEERIFNEQFVH